MSVSAEFIEFLLESLAPVGSLSARRMFGGAGLYADGVMFGLIADDAVYLKANDETAKAYQAEGLEPFTYRGKSKPVRMSYWRAPERLFDDPEEFVAWAEIALDVARAGVKPKRKTGMAKQSTRKRSPRKKK